MKKRAGGVCTLGGFSKNLHSSFTPARRIFDLFPSGVSTLKLCVNMVEDVVGEST